MPDKYSPTAENPYQPVTMPDPTPAPVSPFQNQPQSPLTGQRATGVGAIATMADNILRGYVNGKAMGAAQKVMKVKKQQDDLTASYNADASRLLELHNSGVDQNSPEYKQARAAVDGSWSSMQAFRGQLIEQSAGKKSKTKAGQPPEDLMIRLHSTDPHVKATALYELSQKAGPPVLGQIATMDTPEAKKAREQRQAQQQAQQQLQGAQTQNQLSHEQTLQQRDQIMQIPEDQRTPAQTAQLASANERLTPPAKPVAPKVGDEAKRQADIIIEKIGKDPNYKVTDQEKFILRLAGHPVEAKSKVSVTSRGEIISSDEAGNFKILRGPQGAYRPEGRGREEKPRIGTVGEFSTVEEHTSDAYKKNKDAYKKKIDDIESAEGSAEAKKAHRDAAYKDFEEENKRIGELNSRRTRALGGIPAEDGSGHANSPEKKKKTKEEDPLGIL